MSALILNLNSGQEKLNLMMLILGYEYGGQAASTLNLVKRLPSLGINVSVVACCEGELYNKIARIHSNVFCLRLSKPPLVQTIKSGRRIKRAFSFRLITVVWWLLRATFQCMRFFRKWQIDVCHCSYAHPALILGVVSKLCGVPVICHQRFPFSKSGTFFIERFMTGLLINRFVAISQFVKSTMPLKWQKRVTVVYNGIEEVSSESEMSLRNLVGIPSGKHIIGMAGTFIPQKGWDDFVEIANLAAKYKYDDMVFVAIGGKALRDTDGYSENLKKLSVNDSVKFLGRIPEANKVFKELSAFLFCTRPPGEAFGLVITEAMMAGVPVIAYNNGAVSEIISNEKTGILIPDGDKKAMLAAVRNLVDDCEWREQLGNNGRQRAQDFFSADRTAESMANLIRDIVKRS